LFKIEIPDEHRQRPVIQLVPLVDILFYTLIFFMIISVLQEMETEISINVPKAEQSKDHPRSPGEIIINVDREGRVVVNQRELGSEELEGMLKRIASLYPNQPVIIRADRKTYHEAVVRILDACAAADIWNISFATLKPEAAPS
jgi:biopolymer transport protein ExbD